VPRRLAISAAFLVSGILPLPDALAQTYTPASQPQAPAFEKEITLGKSLAAGAERHEKILTDPLVTEYIAHLAASIGQHTGISMPLVVRIIADKEVRSIALPGGFLYITSGLIARTETEAELAGVLAHEIAHIARHDGMRQLAGNVNSPASTIPMVYMGAWSGACTRFADDKQVTVGLRSVLKGVEQEADNAAIGYLRAAHYDPLGMIEFFNKLRYENPRLAQTWSSEDLLALRMHVEEDLPPDPEYVVTTAMYAHIRTRFIEKPKPQEPAARPTLRRVPSGSTPPDSGV
jgi:beta-barrel assembly-enhancing protease